MNGTEEQRKRAAKIVGETLGTFALAAKPNDPAVKFGMECALAAIIEGDEVLAVEKAKVTALEEQYSDIVEIRQIDLRDLSKEIERLDAEERGKG